MRKAVAAALIVMVVLASQLGFAGFAAAKWAGVDEAVVEKYAAQYGRTARDPLINTDQGDLLLFVFALAGSVGGFICGYYWRKLFGEEGKRDV